MRTVWKQQRAWRVFAAKYKLAYERPFWYKAPTIDGEIKGRRLRIYVDEVVDPVLRIREFRTTVEVYFNSGFATGVAIGSRGFHDVIRSVENVQPVLLPSEPEFAGLIAMGRDERLAEDYIQTRLVPLKRFFGIKKAERLVMGHEDDGFLVLQSADPLEDVKALNAIVRQLFQIADELEPHFGALLPENPPETQNVVVPEEGSSVEEETETLPIAEPESEIKE